MPPANRRTRDTAFADKIARYGINEAPILNAEVAITNVPAVVDVEKYKKQDRKIVFTVDQAVEYVELPVFPGERNVTDKWAQHILEEMISRRFNWDLVILARCEFQGQVYKINGQHTSWARIAAPLDSDPTVREILYKVDTEEQLRQVYGTFDRGNTRSTGHLMKVELLGQDLDPQIQKRTATGLATALRFLKFDNREQYLKVREDQLAAMVASPEIKPLFTTVALFCQRFGKDGRRFIDRQPVLAALLATFQVDEDAAVDFWTDVIEGTNLVKEDARWHLHNYLATTSLGNSPRAAAGKKMVGAEDMLRVCFYLWNRWRRHEVTNSVRIPASRPRLV
jgi:hypothetical protein